MEEASSKENQCISVETPKTEYRAESAGDLNVRGHFCSCLKRSTEDVY